MPPLYTTLPLPEMYRPARPVPKNLYLDVPRVGNVFFDKHARVFEEGGPPVEYGLERAGDLGRIVADLKTHTPTTCGRFEHDLCGRACEPLSVHRMNEIKASEELTG